ncbi:MAG: hypothetical protein P1V97_35480 [Planctomycetota bacterium]|nr:hypothetical protein [Planctomycetota bacterium]
MNRFMCVTFIFLGLGLWSAPLFGVEWDAGGVICIGGGLMFIAMGILGFSQKDESIEQEWNTEKQQLILKSSSGAVAIFPFGAFSTIESHSYTVEVRYGDNKSRTETRYGVRAMKRDGTFLSVDSGYSSEDRASEEAIRLRRLTGVLDTNRDNTGSIPEAGEFVYSPAMQVRETGSLQQWSWSTDRGLIPIFTILALGIGLCINLYGFVLTGEASTYIYLLLPVIFLFIYAFIHPLIKNLGTEKRVTIQRSTLIAEFIKHEIVKSSEQVELSKIKSVVVLDEMLCLFENPKNWSTPLLQLDLGVLSKVDRHCLENHIGAAVAQHTGQDPNTL